MLRFMGSQRVKHHPQPLNLAGNMIDSVNLQQAIAAVLDPLLQGD